MERISLQQAKRDAQVHVKRHERAAYIAKALRKRCGAFAAICIAIAVGSVLGVFIQERPGVSLAVIAGLAGTIAAVISVVQQRYGWREAASIHSQMSSRYQSIIGRIDQLENTNRDNDCGQHGDELEARANAVIDDFGDIQMSAPNTEELEFLGQLISTPGIR
jgi:alpha-L-arabinofuranosidase